MKNSELRKLLVQVLDREQSALKSFENSDNPQIKDLWSRSDARIDMIEDVISAIDGDIAYLKIRINN